MTSSVLFFEHAVPKILITFRASNRFRGLRLPEASAGSRQHYLDNLKVLLIVLVILQHAGQPYGPGGAWWIAPEKISLVNLLVLGMLFAINMAFFMGLFFLISAYFLGTSYDRKGPRKVLKDRIVKLSTPILIFTLLIFPIMDFLLYSSDVSFYSYYLNSYLGFFSNQSGLDLGHLWFLFVLLLFCATYVVGRALFKSSILLKIGYPNVKAIVGFIAAMTILVFIIRIWSPINNWLPFHLFEPAHFPQYTLMFFAGLMAYRNDWLNKISPSAAWKWLSIASWSFAAFGIMYGVWGSAVFAGGFTVPSLAGSAWESTMCVSMSIGLLALFKNRLNSTSTLRTTLSNNTYATYLTHVLIIVALQYMLIDITAPSLAKFAIVSLLGVPLSFILSYLIRKVPYANRIL
jgi:glucan biosynthesis protein C